MALRPLTSEAGDRRLPEFAINSGAAPRASYRTLPRSKTAAGGLRYRQRRELPDYQFVSLSTGTPMPTHLPDWIATRCKLVVPRWRSGPKVTGGMMPES
jgi:hypothetical protein